MAIRSRALAILGTWALLHGAGCAPGTPDVETDGEEPVESDAAVGEGTVEQSMNASCSTATIRPLSEQIVTEMRCMDSEALVPLPSRANLELEASVLPFLVAPAKKALVDALDTNPNRTLHVNSMFRTVAQQYMVRRWWEQGRCGISAAATPGASNHETGLAIDIQSSSLWRSSLEAEGFDWFGSGDVPHFDFVGSGAQSQRGLDVKAFQRLWNRNHPNDTISEDGIWGPQTRARVRQAPAKGFAIGASCDPDAPSNPPDSDPTSFTCDDFPSADVETCAPDGSGRGVCDAGVVTFESCERGCLIQSSGDDVCLGTSAGWSCSGTTAKTKLGNGDYVATAFGCSIAADGSAYDDPGDNCVPACLSKLQASGDCSGLSGPQCERHITWFVADRDRFGCGAKVRVTNTANGKSAVLMSIDAGPACWVETNAGTGVLDMSYRAADYLFGAPVGYEDGEKVHVVEVASDTPLGPVD
ncbi:MAG: D-alanyl-D-alanine carboxypeptidase family protein [Polyangiaceae bacterium]